MFKINFSGFLFLFSRVSAVLAFTLLNFQLIGHENYLQLDVLELVNDNKDAVVRVKAAFRQKDANEENLSKEINKLTKDEAYKKNMLKNFLIIEKKLKDEPSKISIYELINKML